MDEHPDLHELEAKARRMQAAAVAEMVRDMVRRLRGIFDAAPSETGRTA